MSRFHIREATQTETNTLIKITCSTKTPTEHIIIVQQSLIFQNPEAWGKRVHVKAREERNGHHQAKSTWDLWRFYRSSKARTKTQNVPPKILFVILENQIFQNRPSKTIDVRPISLQWKKLSNPTSQAFCENIRFSSFSRPIVKMGIFPASQLFQFSLLERALYYETRLEDFLNVQFTSFF